MSETADLLSCVDHLLYVTDRDPVVMVRGAGMYLWDSDGKSYLDFIGGWAVNALGHSPEVIHRVLCEQSARLVNASPSFFNEPMLRLARRLTEVSCMDRAFFCSTGAEANESAIKIARKYGATRRNGAFEIITTIDGFHGRTLATMAATGKAAWRGMFEPKGGGFRHVAFNDIAAVRNAITDKTAAIMVEPIQGEGGVNPATTSYLRELRSVCDDHGVLLIFDEIQTGIGRTGAMFAYEHHGVEPDVITLGKGLGGGFPVAAMLCTERLNIFEKGEQGGTYTGQPLAAAVALAVVDEVIAKKLPENAHERGAEIKAGLDRLAQRHPIRAIRGAGLLIAFDLAEPVAERIRGYCLRNGLLLNTPRDTMIRLMPPLIATTDDVEKMLRILDAALADAFG